MSEYEYYLHAEHCGVYLDLKISGEAVISPNGTEVIGAPPTETPCPLCGDMVSPEVVTRFVHERYTAMEDDCQNCGEVIVFLPDKLEWRHHTEQDIIEPEYGLRSCEDAVGSLMGLPAGTPIPDYAGQVAEPADTHATVDLKTGEETPSSKYEELKIKHANEKLTEDIEKKLPGFGKSIT